MYNYLVHSLIVINKKPLIDSQVCEKIHRKKIMPMIRDNHTNAMPPYTPIYAWLKTLVTPFFVFHLKDIFC